jgi:hypothetical protein
VVFARNKINSVELRYKLNFYRHSRTVFIHTINRSPKVKKEKSVKQRNKLGEIDIKCFIVVIVSFIVRMGRFETKRGNL